MVHLLEGRGCCQGPKRSLVKIRVMWEHSSVEIMHARTMDTRVMHNTFTTFCTEYFGQSLKIKHFPCKDLAVEYSLQPFLLNQGKVQGKEPLEIFRTHFFLWVDRFLESKLTEKMHHREIHFILDCVTQFILLNFHTHLRLKHGSECILDATRQLVNFSDYPIHITSSLIEKARFLAICIGVNQNFDKTKHKDKEQLRFFLPIEISFSFEYFAQMLRLLLTALLHKLCHVFNSYVPFACAIDSLEKLYWGEFGGFHLILFL